MTTQATIPVVACLIDEVGLGSPPSPHRPDDNHP